MHMTVRRPGIPSENTPDRTPRYHKAFNLRSNIKDVSCARLWFSGMTEASQAFNPGSNPGSRMLFLGYIQLKKSVRRFALNMHNHFKTSKKKKCTLFSTESDIMYNRIKSTKVNICKDFKLSFHHRIYSKFLLVIVLIKHFHRNNDKRNNVLLYFQKPQI